VVQLLALLFLERLFLVLLIILYYVSQSKEAATQATTQYAPMTSFHLTQLTAYT
jgi:hypothetical protein